MPSDIAVLDTKNTRDLRPEVLGTDGRIRVLPTSYWENTTVAERALFGANTGLYSYPTVELVAHLRTLIAGRTAIEIGAGHGVLAEALGIPATDSMQQLELKYRAIYDASGQKIVPYGPNVVRMDANTAVRHYKPDFVIGCWVTHRYSPLAHERGGNEAGIDEEDLLEHCGAYLFVGHERVHAEKPIWRRRHTISYPSFLVSRAFQGGRNLLATWVGRKEA